MGSTREARRAGRYGKETGYTPNALVVAEGALKPETVVTYQNATAVVKTLATWLKTSVQSLADVPGMRQWLDARVSRAVALKAEGIFLADLLGAASATAAGFTPGGTPTLLDQIAGAVSHCKARASRRTAW